MNPPARQSSKLVITLDASRNDNTAVLPPAARGKLERLQGEEGAKGVTGGVALEGQQRMPGVLKNERDETWNPAQAAGLQVKATNMADHQAERFEREPGPVNGHALVNGIHEGTPANLMNGVGTSTASSQGNVSEGMVQVLGQLPPEIEHITYGYLPMSTMITRLAQETFSELNDVINELSDLKLSQPNGAAAADTAQANNDRKLRLLTFAQERRAQFIKVLVLSQWSRHVDSMGRVIDLKVWLDRQRKVFDDACNWMGELKRILRSERMPNPDLRTALEILSFGKAPWLPDLNYLPPEPLPPPRILKTLQSINTQLSIRLHLHENIPSFMRDFSIANGRATFRVMSEFELDLSIADEDPSSQLYFIDLRFLFSSDTAEVPQGRLRDDVEGTVNHFLGHGGLQECYDFLHDFVLSHKINILKHQAYRMSQANWSDHVKIEAVHRSLIIQYWIGRPGPKSWIEIGLRRRRAKRKAWLYKEEDEPHIGLRWFRVGKEVQDVPFAVDVELLSADTLLKEVISAHTDFVFKETASRLQKGQLYSKKILRLKRTRSVKEPIDSRISIQLTALQSCTLVQEPVSGRFSLLPPSPLHSRAEKELNSLSAPEIEASNRIAQLRAIASFDEVEQMVRCHGWDVAKTIRPSQDNIRHHFGWETLRAGFFRKTSWNAQWLLAFTASLAADVWWVVELDNRSTKRDQPVLGPSIRATYKVPGSGPAATMKELSFKELSRIERTAVGLISQFTDCRQLSTRKIPHKLVQPTRSRSSLEMPALLIDIPKQAAQGLLQSEKLANTPWLNHIVKLSFMGISAAKSNANHLVIARTGCAALRSQPLHSMIGSSTTVQAKSGAFAFHLTCPVGQPTMPAILDRLAGIERLIAYSTTLQSLRIRPSKLSLDHIDFLYAKKEQFYRARIAFAADQPPKLSFSHGNPQLRIQDQLTTWLSESDGLTHVIQYLQLSLPLLRALGNIEAAHADDKVTVLLRTAEWYCLRYRDPPAAFDIQLHRRREELMWFVKAMELPNHEKPEQRINDELSEMINGRGDGWEGVSPGIAATLVGVEALLERIDGLFQHLPLSVDPVAMDEPQRYPQGTKRKAEDDGVITLD
ncbi:MAG: hypothetical protein Q9218_002463 [Villophora microphyllina]